MLAELRERLLAEVSDGDLAATVRTFATLAAALESASDKARGG